MLSGRTSFLRSTDLLSQVPRELLESLSSRMTEVRARRGALVFREGEVGDAVYFVVDGSVRIEKEGTKLVNMLPGDCVGEFALIDNGPRSASAVAETDLTLLKWDRADFQKALGFGPEVANGIFLSLTRKLRKDVALQLRAGLERERWQQDLSRAREIQRAMLPKSDFSSPEVEVAGFCRPADSVGGDYYDYLEIGDSRIGLMIADVMGHGFFSGLLVAMAKSCLHTQAAFGSDPPDVMAAMHRTVLHSVKTGLLMSCCYVVLDPRAGKLAWANAGHPPPYLYRAAEGGLVELHATDMLLGVDESPDLSFSVADTSWQRGDRLVLYSDGIFEAENEEREIFGQERLAEVVLESFDEAGRGDLSAAELKERILDAVSKHCQGWPRGDDVTLVVARAL